MHPEGSVDDLPTERGAHLMQTHIPPAAIIVLVTSILYAGIVDADDGPIVTVTPPPAATSTTFDPAQPPSDLNSGEAADTSSEVAVKADRMGPLLMETILSRSRMWARLRRT